jgi:hypothetical protein
MTHADDQTIIAEIKAERDRRRQQQNGQEASGAPPPLLLPPPSDPMAVARVFIDQHCKQQDTLTLRSGAGPGGHGEGPIGRK